MFAFLFPAKINQLMEQLDVYISIKPKPKQPSKVSHKAIVFLILVLWKISLPNIRVGRITDKINH